MSIKLLVGESGECYAPEEKALAHVTTGKFSIEFKATSGNGQPVFIKKLISGNESNEIAFPARGDKIVTLIDIIRQAQDTYLVFPFVTGVTLKDALKQSKLRKLFSDKILIELISELLDGLSTIHATGWLHGDIKPQNIMLEIKDNKITGLRIIDFGKASAFYEHAENRRDFTLVYSAPEIILQQHAQVGPSADIYSMSLILYEILTGEVPFVHTNPEMLIHLMINKPIAPSREISEGLFSVLKKATSKAFFKKPPQLLSFEEREQLMKEAITYRYSDVTSFREDLFKYTYEFKIKQRSWFYPFT